MSGLASLYPPPPPYYKLYTAENCEKVEEYKLKSGNEPLENNLLADLLPPPPPPVGQASYRNFGSIWNVQEQLPSLAESGITQLYPEGSEKSTATLTAELKKLLYSALVGYVGLVQTLSADPTQFGHSTERLQILFINMHHLLNTYRPLQSQETLILKMEDQIAEAKKASAEMRASNAEIRKRLEALERKLPRKTVIPELPTTDSDAWEGFDLDIDFHQGRDESAID